MERVIRKHNSGDIACNDTIIYSENNANIGRNISEDIYINWKVIKPKYYKYTDDNTIIELWYNSKGIILSGKIKGYIGNSWTSELREEITYEEAMYLLDEEQRKASGYNNKDLMSKIEDELEDEASEPRFDITKSIKESKGNICRETTAPNIKQNNNGGASDWYSLPKDANTLQDLIEHRNMNGSVKDIFKACYRLGIKTEDELRDANKMAYYSLREVGRISGRKDYITIAKELMGSQAIEKE